ncbi:9426_t:CDS:2 [Gigaspora margarita]|uniref:9426_t:CDS:1 n=1 Tax=Gigaspora margarita TaxID=4874 RepID=A0ABM8W3M6_GIGMA|nr:9426_t:CDS:2 [Gigaspora margarita]
MDQAWAEPIIQQISSGLVKPGPIQPVQDPNNSLDLVKVDDID